MTDAEQPQDDETTAPALTQRYRPDLLAKGLSAWDWLPDLKSKGVLFGSLFGDLFMRDGQGVWFLDTLEGVLTHEWTHPDGCRLKLNTPEGQSRYLMAGLATAALRAGLEPDRHQAFAFRRHPALGGAFEVDNLELRDADEVLTISGQLHAKLRALPPDTDPATVEFEPDLSNLGSRPRR